MSTLLAIKADQLEARKAKDVVAKDLLTTLIGEIETELKKGRKESETEIVQGIIKAFLKRVNEFLQLEIADEQAEKLARERDILTAYLPTQLTADEIELALKLEFTAPFEMKQKGLMMKFMKEKHAGQYDGKTAGEVVDKLIKG